ncbi:MAG: PAS domain S-box protein [Chloroflexi bacterium]|nr:PAS domain S-box protein [Chloroflexota bacterium]
MAVERDRLTRLRQRAEAALKRAADPSPMAPATIDEMMHELNVYHVELEIQFEELQQTYRSLEAAKQEYASLFDFAPVGYVVTDQKGNVLNANLTACRMLGVDRATLAGATLAEFVAVDSQDAYHLHRRAVLGTGQAQICEVFLRSNGSSVFPAQLTTDVSIDSKGTLRTAISDISLFRQAADSLRRSLAKEKELNQLQARMLSVIAHEFRTPLTIIHSSVETLDHYADHLTDALKKQRYQTIRNFVWYLNDMVQDTSSVGFGTRLLN